MFKTATNRTRKPRKQSRTLPIRGNAIRGDGEDYGKYYHCWHCGFVCNVERDELGDSESVSGITYDTYTDYYSTYPYPYAQGSDVYGGGNENAPATTLLLGRGPVILRAGADGQPQETYVNYVPVISSGCPFCGTKNWRGDY